MAVVSHARKVQFLSGIPFFESFAPPEREVIAARLVSRRFADGESIFMRGDSGSTNTSSTPRGNSRNRPDDGAG